MWKEEDEEMLLTPDAILPEQLFVKRPLSGPERLMYGMLRNAWIELYNIDRVRENGYTRLLKREVIEWICNDDRKYLLSFVNCCEQLGLDPSAVRKALLS